MLERDGEINNTDGETFQREGVGNVDRRNHKGTVVLQLDKTEVAADGRGEVLVVRGVDGEVWREDCSKRFWP